MLKEKGKTEVEVAGCNKTLEELKVYDHQERFEKGLMLQ